MAPTPAKRPAPVDEEQRKAEAAKRAAEIAGRVNRNGAGSPATAPAVDANSTEGKLAAIMAKINAQAAQAKGKASTVPANGPPKPSPTPTPQPVSKGSLSLAEIKARTAAAAAAKSGGASPAPPSSTGPPAQGLSALDKIKARVEAAKIKSPVESAISSPISRPASRDDVPPQRAAAPKPGTGFQPTTHDKETNEPVQEPGRGGLGGALHPRFLKLKQAQEKAAQKGKAKEEADEEEEQEEETTPKPVFTEGQNPYMVDWGEMPGWKPRKYRGTLTITHSLFHRPIMERENKRREAEAIKHMDKSIEKQTTAESEEDILIRVFTVQEPPEIEWWDEDFVDKDVDLNPNVHDLVVQPILIEGPRKKLERKPFVIPLTSKEHKKARRIRRAREHEEKTQKIRLGLEPAPGPKLTKQNFMRVMPDEAIKNPTYVENLVNQQIEQRLAEHEERNASRQLSKEDRLKKTKEQAEKNAKMGLKQMVFRILLGTEAPYQVAQKHKFLLQKNAEQWHDITGVCLVGPRFALLFVEGGEKSTRAYKHLVLTRIKWLEILSERNDIPDGMTEKQLKKMIQIPRGKDETCTLLFEGEIRKRKFPKKWGGVRDAPSVGVMRTNLEKFGLESFLAQAQRGIEQELQEREYFIPLWKPRRNMSKRLTTISGETKRESTPALLNEQEIKALLDPDVQMLEEEVEEEMVNGEVNGDMEY